MMAQLDSLSFDLGPLDDCDVTRSTLARSALVAWLLRASPDSPAIVEAVRREISPSSPGEKVQ